MNERVFSVLEYDKILEILRSHTASEIGGEEARKLRPQTAVEEAQTLLRQTLEADTVYRRTGRSPVDAFPDIRPLLMRVHAAYALSMSELMQVAACLKAARTAREALHADGAEGLLCMMANRLSSHRAVEEEIARCILSEDEMADNASAELARLRRQIRITNEKVRDKLNSMIKSPTYQKYLQEPIITVRNGRFALPVKAEYRAQVPGLIHDTSGSGATLFVEPTVSVELGNELRRLLAEEKHEMERILAGLTALVEPYAAELAGSLTILGELDVIFAKAIMARDQRAHCPQLNADGRLNIKNGRHPLLPRDKVVPINVWLGDAFTTLIVTGPNTGGKTVTLKTVGLLTLMAMAGMFVPADEGTSLSTFTEVFADIGDEQSIEQSLSTFSSHMTNLVCILHAADARSLVLIDELGAGTDPVEGAALAQAILDTLYARGARTVATTHYSEIKAFALTRPGMQNASMEFDVDKLCPTYRLIVGVPGRSNAFVISSRLGLDDGIIAHAQQFLDQEDVAFEDVLSGAELARRHAEEERVKAQKALEDAERAKSEWQQQKKRLEEEKAQMRQKAREEAKRVVSETREEMNRLIQQLRQLKDVDHKALERAIQESRDALRKTESTLYENEPNAADDTDAPKTVQPGDRVRILSYDQLATVLKKPDAKGDVPVQAGVVKLTVKLADLRMEQEKAKPQKSGGRAVLSEQRAPALSLDVRGKTVDEAVMEIDRAIDDTILTGITELSIIHGKGTGALRTGVQSYLKLHPRVKSFRIGAYGEGDAGVTVVTLREKKLGD